MKRVSAKMFFSVVWKGICQTLGWFFGLFGYKRDGKFAKCVWGVFSVSAAVIMAIVAIVFSMEFYDHVKRQYYSDNYCEIHGGQYVSEVIGFVPDYGIRIICIGSKIRNSLIMINARMIYAFKTKR